MATILEKLSGTKAGTEKAPASSYAAQGSVLDRLRDRERLYSQQTQQNQDASRQLYAQYLKNYMKESTRPAQTPGLYTAAAMPTQEQLAAGAAVHQQRQQEQQEANRSFWSSLWDSIRAGVNLSQQDDAGAMDPAAAEQHAQAVRQTLDAWQQTDELRKPVEWEGRQAMVDEYKALQRQLSRGTPQRTPERARLEALRQEIRARDIAAGNGARDLTFQDRASSVATGFAKKTAAGITNALAIAGEAYGRGLAHQSAYDPNQAIIQQLAGGDPEAFQRETAAAIDNEALHQSLMPLYDAADKMGGSAVEDLQRAKNGLGALGQAGVDISENLLEMGFDAGVGALTGGGSLASMFVRVLGDSAREARLNGATLNEQLAHGLTSAGIEVLTEKLADGVAGIYGKGAADEITEELIRKLAETPTGRSMLRLLFGAISEGGEEVVSELLSPFADAMYKRNEDGSRMTLGQLYSEQLSPEGRAEMLHSFLMGAAVSIIGGTGNFINGGNARANAELDMRDAGIGSTENQAGAAWDVLSGRETAEQNRQRREAAEERLRQRGILNEDGSINPSVLFGGQSENGNGQSENGNGQIENENGQNETAPGAGAEMEGANYEQTGEAGAGGASENRNDGLRAGEQTELPGQGEGAQPGGEGQVRQSLGEGNGENLRSVTLRELGVTNAAEGATIQVQDEQSLTGDAAAAAQQVRQMGMEPVAYQGDMIVNGGSVNGYIENGKIFFRTDAKYRDGTAISPDAIVKHEAVHQAKISDPEIINIGREIVRHKRTEAQMKALENVYRETYQDIYDFENMSEEKIADLLVEEIVADAYAGMNFFRAGGETVERVRAAIGSQVESQTAGGQESTRGPPRAVAAGVHARTADRESFQKAGQMERDGASREEILKATGWYRYTDGLWRFEIDDSGARYYRNGDAQFRRDHPEYARYLDLTEKMLNGSISDAEFSELRELAPTWGAEERRLQEMVNRGNVRLDMILDHPALFEAYPELREARVVYKDLGSGEKGAYNPKTNTITLSNDIRTEAENTLIHEIQHAIQNAEGFSGGSSVEYWMNQGYSREEAEQRYRNTAGEIEARDAANRRGMTAEERKNTPPDLGDENTVFAENELNAWNSDTEYDFGVNQRDINQYVTNAYNKQNSVAYKKYMKVDSRLANDVSNEIPDIMEYTHALRDNDVRHIRNSHGEATNEKYPVTENDQKLIPYIVQNYDRVIPKTDHEGNPGLVYVKTMSNNLVYYLEAVTQEYGGEKLLVNKQMIKTGLEDIPDLYGLIDAIQKKQTLAEFLADLKAARKAYVQKRSQQRSASISSIPDYSENSNPQNGGRASAEVTPELSDEEKIRLFGEPEASDIVEAESYDRMEKKEAVQYAKDHNYPMLRRADGREEQAVPGWSWVRDNARKNYGRVIGDAIVNGEPGVEVEFYNKKKGTSRMIGKLPGEVTLVDPQVGGRNVPVGEAPAETDIDALGGDPRSDEMMEEMVGDRTFSTAEPIGSKNPQRRETLREAYERRTEAYMAATNRNDTEYDYDGELAWIKRAEQLLAEQQKKGPKITEMENARAELLEVGEATVRNDTGTYIMKVRKKGDKYQAQVFKNGKLDKSRTFNTALEASDYAIGWVQGRTNGITDAELDAERSEQQEKPGPHWPTGKEYGEEIVRQKKNKAADAATQTLRERIRRANEEIKALKRLERTTGLTERQKAHLFDVQETLDIMNDELTSRKGRRKAKKEKAGTKPAVENKPTRSAAEAKNALMDLFHTAPGTRAEVGKAIEAKLAEIAKSGRITEESRQELYDLLIENGMVPKHAEDTFREIRSWLSGQRIFVNEQERADLGDDFEDLRRQAWGAGIYLTNDIRDGRIDSVNGELAETFGENLFPTDEALSDTLRNMIERANQGKTTQQSLADAIEDEASATGATADEIYADMFNRMDETLRTFAEKAGLEVELKNRSTQQLAKERQRWEDRMESRAQQRRESEIRNKVLKGLQRLSKLRGKAGPEIRSDIDAVLKDIDTQARQITPAGLENLQDLQRAYEAAREKAGYVDGDNMGNWIPNPYVEEKLAALTKRHINDMSLEEVVDLGRTVAALETAIHNQNKMIGEEFDATIEETAKGVRTDVESSRGAKPGFIQKWFMEEHLSPRRFLDMLGGWKNGTMAKLSKSLEDGQTRMLDFQRRAVQSFDSFLSKKANREWLKTASGKKATWEKFTVLDGMGENGTTYTEIELTPMMKVSLYLHSRNMDNLRHIQTGGITIPNKALYLKGDIKEAYAQGTKIKMNPETVRKIAGALTEQERTFANHMITVFDSISKDAINEVSLQLDGFERAGVENYMPIETNPDYIAGNVAAEAKAQTVEGIGSIANERIHASNPILLDDASNVLTRQIDKVSRYYGYAIPLRNFQAVNNYVFHAEGNAFDTSIKEIINKKWGSGAEQYITKMLQDLQSSGGRNTDPLSRGLSKLRGNLAGATLMFNPSVAVSQTASYPGAAQAVGWDGLAAGLVAGRVDPKLIEKYSPLYWYRNQGNSTQELGDYMKEKSLEQKLPWVLNWIQKMDSATIRRLWAAAEYRVSKDNPGLKPGSKADIEAGKDAYYKAVAEVFNRAVYDTQPNYTNMERAQILRSDSDVTKFLTMYKTVPLQYYGMMVEATGRLQAAMQSGDKAAITEARKYAANTFGGLLAANTVYVAMKALFKGFRKKDKDYRDEEGKLTAGSVTKQLGKDLAETYAGSVIGGAEMLSVAESLLTGSKFYGPDMSALSYVEDMVGAVNSMFQAIGDEDPRKAAGAIKDAAITLAQGFGVPAKNMETYLLAGIRWTFPKVAMEYDNLFGGIGKADLKNMDEQAVGTAVNLILQNRAGVKLDPAVTDELARLYSSGELAAIPTNTPESFTYNGKTVEITDRAAYDDAWGAPIADAMEDLVTSEYYADAEDENKAALLNKLYQYATVEARKAVDGEYTVEGNSTYGWTEKVQEAVQAGVELADAICAVDAFGRMSADKNDKGEYISGTRVDKVVNYLESMNITDAQRALLYKADGHTWNYPTGITQYLKDHPEYDFSDPKAVEAFMEGYNSQQSEKKYYIDQEGAQSKMRSEAYREIYREQYGAEYALQYASKTAYEMAQKMNASVDLSYDDYYDFYIGTRYLFADKDENGNTISGSKKQKVVDFIDDMDVTNEQKDALYIAAGYTEKTLNTTPWNGGDGVYTKGGGRRRGGRGRRRRAVKVPEGKGTGIIELPKVSGSGRSSSAGKSAGKSTGGMSGAADASLSLLEIIDKYYGGNALAAAMDGGAKARGRTKVDFEV